MESRDYRQHQDKKTHEPKDEEFSAIDREIADEYRKSTKKDRAITKIAEKFLAEVKNSVSGHYKSWQDKNSKAESALQDTIVPWLRKLEDSGRLAKLVRKDGEIEIAREIYYPRVQSTTRFLTDDTGQITLESVRSHIECISSVRKTPESIIESLRRTLQAGNSDGWQAILTLERPYGKRGFEFVITPWPEVGGGFGYAMSIESYRTRIPLEDIEEHFAHVHPNIWLGLGEWINSGRTTKHIEKELRRRKTE